VVKDLDFNLTKGDTLAITGEPSSGKTSVLLAILQELPTLRGSVTVEGSLAYVS